MTNNLMNLEDFDNDDPFDRDALGRFNFDYETKKDIERQDSFDIKRMQDLRMNR